MYTNTSKFRLRGKYGLFTIPKGILNDLGWKPKDLIGFWGIDEKAIHIQRVCTEERLAKIKKEELKYNTDIYKRIAKFGGKTGTWGIKSLPEFLLKEFKPKDKQEIYFIPAKYTWLAERYPQDDLKDIIFAAFNPDYLKRYEKPKQEDKEKLNKEYKEFFKRVHQLPFFNKSLKISEKNSRKARNKLKRKNKEIIDSRIAGLECLLAKLRGWKKEVQESKHPKKEDIVLELGKRIEEVQLEKKKLEKDRPFLFKELTEEEIDELVSKRHEEKIKNIEKIKRRYNEENLSST